MNTMNPPGLQKLTDGFVPPKSEWDEKPFTAALVLSNGIIIRGYGLGATGEATGEVCFNTAISGYQEILTDPSYAGQIITFTFPHIGNVGVNPDDIETSNLASSSGVRGCVLRATSPNHRITARASRSTNGSKRVASSELAGSTPAL